MTIKNEIARDILTYLVEHPYAQDTLEGIVEWWLLEQKIRFQTRLVKEALEELVAKGLVDEIKGANSRIHFRLNENKIEDVRKLLKNWEGDIQ